MSGVSIIIPVYNSELSIAALVELLVNTFQDKYNLEIILVNDCSRDNSEKECFTCYKKFPNIVKFYSLSKNVGEHNAVMAGLNQAKGDYIVIMDDDFQNPVSEVSKLIEYAKANSFDVVYSYYKEKRHSFFRNLGSKFNDKVANLMLKKPKDLYLSSFKILNKFIKDEIIKYNLPYPYIDGLIIQTTSNIGKIQLEHETRLKGKSNYTLSKMISLWLNMFINFSTLPLRVAIIAGFFFSFVGFSLGIYTVIDKIMHPDLPRGYTITMVIIATFSGIQLIAIGMLGEYLGRMFLSQNKKPQFSIRKRYE